MYTHQTYQPIWPGTRASSGATEVVDTKSGSIYEEECGGSWLARLPPFCDRLGDDAVDEIWAANTFHIFTAVFEKSI